MKILTFVVCVYWKIVKELFCKKQIIVKGFLQEVSQEKIFCQESKQIRILVYWQRSNWSITVKINNAHEMPVLYRYKQGTVLKNVLRLADQTSTAQSFENLRWRVSTYRTAPATIITIQPILYNCTMEGRPSRHS